MKYLTATLTLTQKEWSRWCGLSLSTICNRLKRGWTVEDTLTKPPDDYGKIAKLARKNGLNPKLVNQRLFKGWSLKRALYTPPRKKNERVAYSGEYKQYRELAKQVGMETNTLAHRVRQLGWTLEEALTTPVGQKRKKNANTDNTDPQQG